MLTRVDVTNAQGDLLSLPFEDPTNGIAVEDIGGLGPVKATIASSSFAQLSGSQYHASHRESRNITMRLCLYPDYASSQVADLRDTVYNWFISDSAVHMRFYDDRGRTVDIDGRVEACEPPLFAKEPLIDISIICFYPDFVDLTPVVISGNTVSTSTETPETYIGTVPAGFTFVLNVNRSLSEFTIYFRAPDGTLTSMDVSAALVAGDVVTISTVPGSKSATLLRSGTSSSFLYAVTPQSDWYAFKKGVNNIRVYATGAAIPFTITYTTRYGGL
jgi:hypothetical protein